MDKKRVTELIHDFTSRGMREKRQVDAFVLGMITAVANSSMTPTKSLKFVKYIVEVWDDIQKRQATG